MQNYRSTHPLPSTGSELEGHADWCLPNRKEMLSLVHRGWDEGGYGGGVYNLTDWLNRQGFESVIGGFHWTSTTCLPRPGSRHAWRLSLSNGHSDCDPWWAEKSYQYPMLPVRTVDMGHEDSLLNSVLGLTH